MLSLCPGLTLIFGGPKQPLCRVDKKIRMDRTYVRPPSSLAEGLALPATHFNSPRDLHSLGWALFRRYENTASVQDLDEAISCAERAAEMAH